MAAPNLTVQELAERLHMTSDGVYGMNRDGGGPPYFRAGKRCLYRLQDVEAWEKSRLITSDA